MDMSACGGLELKDMVGDTSGCCHEDGMCESGQTDLMDSRWFDPRLCTLQVYRYQVMINRLTDDGKDRNIDTIQLLDGKRVSQ